jgi:hypothetical protein
MAVQMVVAEEGVVEAVRFHPIPAVPHLPQAAAAVFHRNSVVVAAAARYHLHSVLLQVHR